MQQEWGGAAMDAAAEADIEAVGRGQAAMGAAGVVLNSGGFVSPGPVAGEWDSNRADGPFSFPTFLRLSFYKCTLPRAPFPMFYSLPPSIRPPLPVPQVRSVTPSYGTTPCACLPTSTRPAVPFLAPAPAARRRELKRTYVMRGGKGE